MPSISIPAAIVGASVVGAGASIAGSMANAGAAKKAAQTNANALTSDNAANIAEAERVRQANSDLAGQTLTNDQGVINDYEAKGAGLYQPYIDTGSKATSAINAILGLGGDAQAQRDALNNWANTTGMQFQLKTGSDAITGSKATAGLLNSGSTLKALNQYGQNVGSTYFGNYLAGLQGQQQLGVSGTNALSNVYGNSASLRTGANATALNAVTGANSQAGQNILASNTNTTNALVANTNNLLNATTAANNNTTSSINGLLNNGVSAYAFSNGLKNPNASSFGNTSTVRI